MLVVVYTERVMTVNDQANTYGRVVCIGYLYEFRSQVIEF